MLVFLYGLGGASLVRAQATKPLIYTTAPKPVVAQLASGNDERNVRCMATLTITAANYDDTVAGTLVFTFADQARQKLAHSSSQLLRDIPTNVVQKGVTATFQSGRACPVLHLEVGAPEIEVAGVKLRFNRLTLEINETPAEMTQLFCNWTRQINVKRQRRGIIAAINRLLVGEQ